MTVWLHESKVVFYEAVTYIHEMWTCIYLFSPHTTHTHTYSHTHKHTHTRMYFRPSVIPYTPGTRPMPFAAAQPPVVSVPHSNRCNW